MNTTQAKEFIAKYPNAKSFVKPSHLEELSPLLEVSIEAVTVRKDEFHELESGKTYMPRKETMDKFAGAAGVSFPPAAESTRREGSSIFVGTSQAAVVGPDGKLVLGPPCEYEFDVDVRLEEMKLNKKTDCGTQSKRDYTPAELARERIQLMKVGRQRANTGARSRATVAVLGMQTGFKGLFKKEDPADKTVTFLFSRVIINAKNEFVMNRMLDGIAGNTAALFGPAQAAQIGAPVHHAHDAEVDARPAEGQETKPVDDFALSSGDEPAPTELEQLTQAFVEWASSDNQDVKHRAQRYLDAGVTDLRVLRAALFIIKHIGSGNKKGFDLSTWTLDNKTQDVAALEEIVGKIKALPAALSA